MIIKKKCNFCFILFFLIHLITECINSSNILSNFYEQIKNNHKQKTLIQKEKSNSLNKKNDIKLRIAEEKKSNKFLHDSIYQAENNKFINNFMSTKYLYWNQGFKGKNVKIGILDSGINKEISDCKNIIKIKNFSDDIEDDDLESHGTYLSSIICGNTYGIAKESDIFIYKIFTGSGITKTPWLINALQEAIYIDKCNIINLSFGGINYNDEKITELINNATNNNILVIASSGNEGPSYGSISFPGTLPSVLTVGSLSKEIFSIYKYSSRGPAMIDKTTLLAKPNVYAPGEDIIGLSFNKNNDKYRKKPVKVLKNGSSVATAIVTGFIALAMSEKVSESDENWNISYLINLIQNTNIILPELNNEYEKFAGVFNPQGILGHILENKNEESNKKPVRIYNYDYGFQIRKNKKQNNPQIYFPEDVLYSTMQEKEITLLVLNELDYKDYNKIKFPFYIKDIQVIYNSYKSKKQEANNDYNKILSISDNCVKFELISPNENTEVTRTILLKLKIIPENQEKCAYYKGEVELKIIISDQSQKQELNFFYSYHFIPKPFRMNRILFDRGHNLIYPYDKFVMKDNLLSESFDYDWTYESINANYRGLNNYLIKNLKSFSDYSESYFIEETNKSLDSINLNLYSVLIIIDAEKDFSEEEIIAMQNAFEHRGLGILIISEWNNELILKKLNDYKKNKKKDKENDNNENISVKGGSNISNLNKFLLKYNIALSENIISGEFYLLNKLIEINSGTSISLFPKEGILFGGYFNNDEKIIIDEDKRNNNKNINNNDKLFKAIIGLLDSSNENNDNGNDNFGRIAIFTDSYCVDDYQLKENKKDKNCFWLISYLIQFLIHGLYIINDLNLQSKKKLAKTYYDYEHIYINGKNNKREIYNLSLEKNQITMNIPNIFELELRKQIYFPSSKEILDIIKGVLAVFIPIFFVLLIMLMIIKFKVNKYKKMRYDAIKSLEEIKPLTMILNEKNYLKKHAKSISSEDSFFFFDFQLPELG